jgi:glycerol kinase
MAYQTVDAVRAMEEASGVVLEELKADGGAVVNGWLMKFQADVLGVPVVVPEVSETTALGAAYLAGVAVGIWSEGDISGMWREAERYEPTMSEDARQELLSGWRRALERARSNEADRSG